MSDNSQPEDIDEYSSVAFRSYGASPLGVAAVVAGIVLAIVFLLRFNSLIDHVKDHDLKSAIQALQITVIAVWVGIALWGWYLIRDGLERAQTNRRLNVQDKTLSRIEHAISEIDQQKEVANQKSKSFWDWRRGETS